MEIENKINLLNTILSDHVNCWLQWAETKHGVLLAANAATLFGWGSFISNDSFSQLSDCMKCACIISIIALVVSIYWSLKSFFPNLGRANTNTYINNIIFYGDCAKESHDSYYTKTSRVTSEELARDISEEIVMNSKIAIKKYKLFRKALLATGISYLLFAIFLIYTFFSV